MDRFIARFNEAGYTQTIKEHLINVSYLCDTFCDIKDFSAIAKLTGLTHDGGKYGDAFQAYIRKRMNNDENARTGEVNHATAGGLIINTYVKHYLSELMMHVIFSHHGLCDCLQSDVSIIDKRESMDYQESNNIDLDIVKKRFFDENEFISFENLCIEAVSQLKNLEMKLFNFTNRTDRKCGSLFFYLGMFDRLLLSLLIDSDCTDAKAFKEGMIIEKVYMHSNNGVIWSKCIQNYNDYLKRLKDSKKPSTIDIQREKISQLCYESSQSDNHLYRLSVPTGAGKTLSSLRFALHHASHFNKKHIIYVAPFKSILEQNADEIRSAINMDDLVLEHHSDVLHENEDENELYNRLVENWDSPVIVTTSVQFLNTLFTSKKGSIRRMHNLCNSVIILDEVQAFPVKTMKLVNGAINFLTEFCDSTVVLCSATQPLLSQIKDYRLLEPLEMIPKDMFCEEDFKRTTIINEIENNSDWSIDDLCKFILEKFEHIKQLLVIVNTKACAKQVYDKLAMCLDKDIIAHLSTNMFVQNRRDKLEFIKEQLKNGEDMICVSTPLIEAGVDISFQGVIRSLTGLDSIIQAAGRCNRHKTIENGNVYLVKMSDKAENISSLEDLKKAQSVMFNMLMNNDKDLTSQQEIQEFYKRYQYLREAEMDYDVSIDCIEYKLIDLLSDNADARIGYIKKSIDPKAGKKRIMMQAFKMAGDNFHLIQDNDKFSVVIDYDKDISSMLEELQDHTCKMKRQREILRTLQLYSVNISITLRRKLGSEIRPICEGLLFALDKRYYSVETGVSEVPVKLMETQIY